MNIRSLTRGDGVVIGAAVLLFIASFLDFYSVDCNGDLCDRGNVPGAWDSSLFPVLPSIYLAGLIAAGLFVAARFQPAGRKVAGLGLEQWGIALAVFAVWSALWTIVGGPDVETIGPGAGQILGLLATFVLAAGTILGASVPALQTPLLSAPRQQTPSPYGVAPNAGYGYPGPAAQQGASSPYGATQPGQPYGQPAGYGAQQPTQPGQPGGEFAPFWFAVPVTRPLYGEDGSPTPIAELAPGTWYLAVDQRGQALVAQTQDGRRGVLQDTTGIQRG